MQSTSRSSELGPLTVMEQDTDFIPDLPEGPLSMYRKQASFDWKKLKLVFDKPEILKLKLKVWKTLEADVLFHNGDKTHSVDEQKRLAMLQLVKYLQYKFYTDGVANNNYKKKTRTMMDLNEAMAVLNLNISVKFALGVSLFANAILSLGTERHLPLYEAAWRGEIFSCVALTEVGHGSNTKKMRTTATYDPCTHEFVVHTPDFQAAKCWIGNLGKTCTYALLFAQLYTADGTCHGLHGFVTPIRDPKTLLPFPGIIVGDMGEKTGLNGIDNGFIIFQQYRIPRESLLNRLSDVTLDGEYETMFTTPEQQLGAALENLSAARVGIMGEGTNACCSAVAIAVRYAAVRKQFGPSADSELPILEYQLHQWRLFPYMAATCALKVFVADFTDQYLECVERSNSGESIEDLPASVSEIHAMVSSTKPLVTWTCRDTIQECREACGGHGFLKASGLGDLRNNFDASVTYEGDNNVLVQQTSNWLLRQWARVLDGSEVASPYHTVNFLADSADILKKKFRGQDVTNNEFILDAYQWLVCWLLRETHHRLLASQELGEDRFTARNNAQVFRARTLSLVYGENNALTYFWRRCNSRELDGRVKAVLTKLHSLYGLWCLDKHLSTFYQGGYATGSTLADLVKEGILQMCSQLKSEAVGVADALAPPDFVLNSVIGKSDGKLYDNLQAQFFHNSGAMERPTWWSEIAPKPLSKL
ncbi:peroxisomal acyl-coenzyme A oxidase 3 isoform X2 [Periplaneta americana]